MSLGYERALVERCSEVRVVREKEKKKKRMLRLIAQRLSPLGAAALAAPPAAAALAAAADPDAAVAAAQAPVRLARSVSTAVSVASDYKRTQARIRRAREGRSSGGGGGGGGAGAPTPTSEAEGGEKRAEEELKACHRRGAARLRDLCHANGGIYIKLGQHLATLDHLLPEEYVGLMKSTMLNTCPVSDFEGVAKTIAEDLGERPETLFASFEKEPVASASLAQVHRATAKDGRQLAVKVQHRGLREACRADVATVAALAAAAKLLFDGFDLSWLVDEIEANLPRELDFCAEARNAERCQRNLDSARSSVNRKRRSKWRRWLLPFSSSASNSDASHYYYNPARVRVPRPAPDLSSPRVLCMEWVEGGIPVADRAALISAGLDPTEVAALVARTFAEMIFKFGFVHSDAHPGNALVQAVSEDGEGDEEGARASAAEKKKETKKRGKKKRKLRASVVLLDHGLYRNLGDAFRVEYAALWASILAGDEASILRHARQMGAAEAGPLFASMLTMKPWRAISGNDNVFLGEGGGAVKKERPPTTTEALETSSPSSSTSSISSSSSSSSSPSPSSPSSSTNSTNPSFADRLAATDADAAEARAYASEHAGDINALLARLPRELLLLLKTNDCLRSLDRSLGVSPANSFLATAAAVKEALVEAGRGDEWGVGKGGGGGLGGLWRRAALAAAGLWQS